MPPKWFSLKGKARTDAVRVGPSVMQFRSSAQTCIQQSCTDAIRIEPPAKRAGDACAQANIEHAYTAPDTLNSDDVQEGHDLEASMSELQASFGGSDEALVDAINAVVIFADTPGSVRVLAAQPSDVAYLVGDSVFWPLVRRLAAEVAALESGVAVTDDAMWTNAPGNSDDVIRFAEMRGYILPGGLTVPTSVTAWRHSFLSEAANDLMIARLQSGRGFSLPALAAPPATCDWEERPTSSHEIERLVAELDATGGEVVANNLIEDLEAAVLPFSEDSNIKHSTTDRLSALADMVTSQQCDWTSATLEDNGPVLCGGWSSEQEKDIHMASVALQKDYSTRRQILLRRLDVTVQALCSCEKARAADAQRYTANVLSSMWAGWRRNGSEAPFFSQWSALAASRSMLSAALRSRVSGLHNVASSKVKSFRMIGHVPDRGGMPEGYGNAARQATGSRAVTGWAFGRMQPHCSNMGSTSCSSKRPVLVLPPSWYDLSAKRARGN